MLSAYLIPARGLKQTREADTATGNGTFRLLNPRKGTETFQNGWRCRPSFSTFRLLNPRKGTETTMARRRENYGRPIFPLT